MKKFVALSVLLLAAPLMANTSGPASDYEIGSIVTIETTGLKSMAFEGEDPQPTPEAPKKPITFNEGAERVGKVIQFSKDLAALGEQVYELVKKGRPVNQTNYAAISVVPKDPTTKEFVSPFDLEGFSMPVERSFTASVTNLSGKEVVRFDYQLVYAYGGSFDGKGKYLTSVMIVPKQIQTSWGWEFNATMKLDAIMNHGSKENPIAGAMVTMKYQMNGWSKSVERNDTIHLTGVGEVKAFGVK